MKQNSKRLTSILLALGFVVIALVALFDLIQPAYANMMMTKGQIAGAQSFLTTEKTAVAQAQQLISQYQNQSQSSQSTMLALPSGPDAAGAVAQIYGLAQNNNITIQTIGISPPTLEQVTQPSTGGSGTASTVQIIKPLGQIVLQITAAGSYENLKSFLMGLETNIRIFDVQGISITPAQTPVVVGKNLNTVSPDLFTYNIKVVTYYQAP
jgi:Tfp pilus assembly protein PilO